MAGFVPGKSGNPNGRPVKDRHQLLVEVLAREHTEAALQTLVQIMGNEEARDTARVAAAVAVLNRGWGMPKQDVNLSGHVNVEGLNDTDLEEAVRAELAEFFASAIRRDKGTGETAH